VTAASAVELIVEQLGFAPQIEQLRCRVSGWLAGIDPELREPLEWAFAGAPKYFRPLTVFACRLASSEDPGSPEVVESAFALELMHNMSLVVDDVLDGSEHRRGVATVPRRFGHLPALMAAGYLVAEAFDAVVDDPFVATHLAELLRRLGAAECLQWRLRRQPLGVEDWRRIAGEDTGSMFEVAAVLGGRSQRLRRYGHLLGVLYHGCDDVGDVRGLEALGGGGADDLRDGILTLPAALAIRDPQVRELFVVDNDDPERLAALSIAFRTQLEAAEAELDDVADGARREAETFAADPKPLLGLVEHVRTLSQR
jgi:geranylgeranyl pyrophosphate synthase